MDGKGLCPFLYDESHIPHATQCLKDQCEMWVPEKYEVGYSGEYIYKAHCGLIEADCKFISYFKKKKKKNRRKS